MFNDKFSSFIVSFLHFKNVLLLQFEGLLSEFDDTFLQFNDVILQFTDVFSFALPLFDILSALLKGSSSLTEFYLDFISTNIADISKILSTTCLNGFYPCYKSIDKFTILRSHGDENVKSMVVGSLYSLH